MPSEEVDYWDAVVPTQQNWSWGGGDNEPLTMASDTVCSGSRRQLWPHLK